MKFNLTGLLLMLTFPKQNMDIFFNSIHIGKQFSQ